MEENLDIGAYLELDARVRADRKREVFELFPRLAERRKQAGGTLSGVALALKERNKTVKIAVADP